jgi:beta-galactosidase
VKVKLELKGLRDYALIYLNGEKVGELNRYYNEYSWGIDIPANSILDIIVENMGRSNYGAEIIHIFKGITSPVKIDGKEITRN